jgi:hypothetical protein
MSVSTSYFSSGKVKKTIHVITNDPENKEITLNLSFDVNETLVVRPLSINFGKVSKGDTYKKEITISNKDEKPLSITDIKTSPDKILRIRGEKKFTLKPKKRKTVTLLFAPNEAKAFFGTVTIITGTDPAENKVIRVQAEVTAPPQTSN